MNTGSSVLHGDNLDMFELLTKEGVGSSSSAPFHPRRVSIIINVAFVPFWPCLINSNHIIFSSNFYHRTSVAVRNFIC